MQNDKSINEYDDEIDLRELFSVLWRAKNLYYHYYCSFCIVSVLFALILPNQYEASTVLAPAQQETGGLAGALGQLGGLASLAGVSIGEQRATRVRWL